MTIGICIGMRQPLLRGDMDLIMQAKKQCDSCLVAAAQPQLDKLRQLLGDDPLVRFMLLSEDTQSLTATSAACVEQAAKQISEEAKLVWYVVPELARLLTGKEVIIGGEDTTPLLRDADKRGSCHRILITGWASEGKTTLARDLAVYFQIPYIPEAARVYMEEHQLKDEELTDEDFLAFIRLQNEWTNAAHDSVIISDTDTITTLAYTISYANDPCIRAISFDSIEKIKREIQIFDWDKIYVLPPKNTYVDDGLRYMNQADLEVRNTNFSLLIQLLDSYGFQDKITYLSGNYWENFIAVKQYIQNIMSNEQTNR